MPRPGGGCFTSVANLPVWDDFVNIKRAGIRPPVTRSILPSEVRSGPELPVRPESLGALPVAPRALRVFLSALKAVRFPP